jgi:hypothetical protein
MECCSDQAAPLAGTPQRTLGRITQNRKPEKRAVSFLEVGGTTPYDTPPIPGGDREDVISGVLPQAEISFQKTVSAQVLPIRAGAEPVNVNLARRNLSATDQCGERSGYIGGNE